MVWFRVDDTLAFHAKTLAAGNEAMGMWVRAGAWASQQLTDGFVPESVVQSMGGTKLARRLVTVGFWDKDTDGYRFHEWCDRNPSRDQVEQHRKSERERLREWRETKRRKGEATRQRTEGSASQVEPPAEEDL